MVVRTTTPPQQTAPSTWRLAFQDIYAKTYIWNPNLSLVLIGKRPSFGKNKGQMGSMCIIYTLQGTNISPEKGTFEDDFPFPQVGYVNSLEGNPDHLLAIHSNSFSDFESLCLILLGCPRKLVNG